MLRETGNSVPRAQQSNAGDSDSGSYTGSSGSYTETASQHAAAQQPQTQQQYVAVPQSVSKSRGRKQSPRAEPASASPNRQMPSQQFDEVGNDDDQDGGKKGHGRHGKDKARHMVNSALNAPTVRMRAVSASIAGRDSQRVTIYVFFVIALIHLLFEILSCTLSQIDVQGGGCYTFWGYQARCDDVSYTNRTSLIKNCGQLRSTLQTGAAFSIMSILTSTAIVAVSWMMCGRLRHADYVAHHQRRYQNLDAGTLGANAGQGDINENQIRTFNPGQLKLVTIIIVSISLAFELIAWAVVAGIKTQHYCDATYHLSTTGTYGVGFGIGLTAWIVEILVFVVYIVVV